MSHSYTLLLTLSFLAAILISVNSGTQYLFSVYGPAVGKKLKFSSVQLNTISSAANYGMFLSNPLFGWIVDNHGPRKSTLIGAVGLFSGFFGLALSYNKIFPPFFGLCVFYLFLTGVGSSAGFIAALTTQAKNFKHRGTAIGVPMAFFAISAFIFSVTQMIFFQDDIFHFLVFLALSTGIGELVASYILRVIPADIAEIETEMGTESEIGSIFEVNIEEAMISESSSPSSLQGTSTAPIPSEHRHNEQTPLLHRKQIHSQDEDIGGWEFFRNKDARFLFLIIFLLGGSGLMYINNVSSIIKFLYKSTSAQPFRDKMEGFRAENNLQIFQNFHVSLLSIFSCFGRMSVGFISDLTKKTFQLDRLWFLILASVSLLSGQVFAGFLVEKLETLGLATALIGFGYGNMFGIVPTITSEWFGLRRFGSNWGFLSYAIPIGGQMLSLLFALNKDFQNPHCAGPKCYNRVFWVSGLGCILSMFATCYLLFRRVTRD
ncbi:hypothetical protein G9A89_022375 [Geosiphon pyriformis]|nr:hypothetical protein G9A89_022375 [Geosiphon pyriformis]